MKKLILTGVVSLLFLPFLKAQYWTLRSKAQVLSGTSAEPQIRASDALFYELNFDEFYQELLQAEDGATISLPTSSGALIELQLNENQTMSDGLKEKFPGIRTFDALPLEYGNTWGKVEISANGLRAMVFSPGKSTLYIDPLFYPEPNTYIVYQQDKFITDKTFHCHVGSEELNTRYDDAKAGDPYNECLLKTFRIAIAATGEYTSYHGGVDGALAGMATSMNRINGLYGRDFGVNFTIVEDNDDIIFTDQNTDPYNGNLPDDIDTNQEVINNIIGLENYDIGHLVDGTNNGGLAQLNTVCVSTAARAATSSDPPLGDPFDIRVLAHEMGHQFSATHTQNNNCNRSNPTAVEPGSGSTPMSYAAICAPNVQFFTDDYFHGRSMEQIGPNAELSGCPVYTEIENTSPVLQDLPEDLIFIPISTPFSLAANATDAEGDTLTYCWEQIDNEVSPQPPLASSVDGPSFRSFQPSLDSVRYFPSLASLVSNGPFTWEVLPSVERQINFRVTVRDNAPVAGCTQYDDVTIQTVASAGPFEVIYPSNPGIVWQPFTEETVLWDVANTDASPINAETVNIWLSTNNGFSYPLLLAEDVPNTGSYTLEVPNLPTTIAKIMIQNSQGTFFDVSNSNFDIIGFENGFFFDTDFQGAELCPDEDFSFDLELVEVGTYSELVDLVVTSAPENSSISLSADQASIGESITVTASDFSGTPSGEYLITIMGTGGDFDNTISFPIAVLTDSPGSPSPQNPANGEGGVPTSTALQWEALEGEPGISYSVELATDPDFSTIVASGSSLDENVFSVNNLEPETEFFWRVFSENDCASSEASQVFSFTTYSCLNNVSDDLPLEIEDNSQDIYTSTLFVDQAGIIADIDVINLQGTHERVSELVFRLENPNGISITLASNLCGINLTLQPNNTLEINSPAGIAGVYETSAPADWSGTITSAGMTAQGVQPIDAGADGDIHDLCQFALNAEQLEGNIALINRSPDEGGCDFDQQVTFAQEAGAIAAIIINNVPEEGIIDLDVNNPDPADIPAVMISYEDGQILLSAFEGEVEDFSLSFDDQVEDEGIPCPPADGGVYRPFNALSAFEGFNAQGEWKLEVEDTQDENGGEIQNWGLRICYADDITSTSEESINQVVLFPNPTNSSLFVELGEYKAERALLMDLSGRVLENKAVQSQRLEFNLSRYANGLYFVRLEGSGASVVYKVVKGH